VRKVSGISTHSGAKTAVPLRRAFLLTSLLLSASVALGHPLDVGALTLNVAAGEARATLDLGRQLTLTLLAPGQAIDASSVFGATLGSGPLSMGGAPCQLLPSKITEAGERVAIDAVGSCPSRDGELRWALPFIERGPPSFRLLVHANLDGVDQERVLEAGDANLRLTGPSQRGFGQFVLMGIQHIGAWPSEWIGPHGLKLPDGIDHILFLLALLLSGVQLIPVLKTVTGFTIGHSITLSLATLGVVQLPSRLVESAIALSIAYVAGEDLLWSVASKPKRAPSRWPIAAAFGLVHGFGFARALAELHLPRSRLVSALFGFNVGVEIGQEIIVALAAPVLWLLFKWPPFRRVGVPACAAAILGAALVWFVKRAFLR
jgi:hypothetical protein